MKSHRAANTIASLVGRADHPTTKRCANMAAYIIPQRSIGRGRHRRCATCAVLISSIHDWLY